jgi:hypothetical protein
VSRRLSTSNENNLLHPTGGTISGKSGCVKAEFGGDYTSPRRRAMSAACASSTYRSRSESGSSGWACGGTISRSAREAISGVTEAGGCGIISSVAGHLRRRCRYVSRTTSARNSGRGFVFKT